MPDFINGVRGFISNGPAGMVPAEQANPSNPVTYLDGTFASNCFSTFVSTDGKVPVLNPHGNTRATAGFYGSLVGAVTASGAVSMGVDPRRISDVARTAIGGVLESDNKASYGVWSGFVKNIIPAVNMTVFKDDPVAQSNMEKVYGFLNPIIDNFLKENDTAPINSTTEMFNPQYAAGVQSSTPTTSPGALASNVLPSSATSAFASSLVSYTGNNSFNYEPIDVTLEPGPPNSSATTSEPGEFSFDGLFITSKYGSDKDAKNGKLPLFDFSKVKETPYVYDASRVAIEGTGRGVFKSLLTGKLSIGNKNLIKVEKSFDNLRKLGIQEASIQNYRSATQIEYLFNKIIYDSIENKTKSTSTQETYTDLLKSEDFLKENLKTELDKSTVKFYSHKLTTSKSYSELVSFLNENKPFISKDPLDEIRVFEIQNDKKDKAGVSFLINTREQFEALKAKEQAYVSAKIKIGDKKDIVPYIQVRPQSLKDGEDATKKIDFKINFGNDNDEKETSYILKSDSPENVVYKDYKFNLTSEKLSIKLKIRNTSNVTNVEFPISVNVLFTSSQSNEIKLTKEDMRITRADDGKSITYETISKFTLNSLKNLTSSINLLFKKHTAPYNIKVQFFKKQYSSTQVGAHTTYKDESTNLSSPSTTQVNNQSFFTEVKNSTSYTENSPPPNISFGVVVSFDGDQPKQGNTPIPISDLLHQLEQFDITIPTQATTKALEIVANSINSIATDYAVMQSKYVVQNISTQDITPYSAYIKLPSSDINSDKLTKNRANLDVSRVTCFLTKLDNTPKNGNTPENNAARDQYSIKFAINHKFKSNAEILSPSVSKNATNDLLDSAGNVILSMYHSLVLCILDQNGNIKHTFSNNYVEFVEPWKEYTIQIQIPEVLNGLNAEKINEVNTNSNQYYLGFVGYFGYDNQVVYSKPTEAKPNLENNVSSSGVPEIHILSFDKIDFETKKVSAVGINNLIKATDIENNTGDSTISLQEILEAALKGETTVNGVKIPKLSPRIVNAYANLKSKVRTLLAKKKEDLLDANLKQSIINKVETTPKKEDYILLNPEFYIKSGGTTYNFEMFPAVKSVDSSQGMQAPGADHGVVFKSTVNIAKINIPGSTPVYQAMGIGDEIIEFVGAFIGERQTVGGDKGDRIYDQDIGIVQASKPYHFFKAYEESVAIRKLQLGGFKSNLVIKTNDKDGIKINVNGYIISFERYIQKDDRVWYKITFRVTDHSFDEMSGLNPKTSGSYVSREAEKKMLGQKNEPQVLEVVQNPEEKTGANRTAEQEKAEQEKAAQAAQEKAAQAAQEKAAQAAQEKAAQAAQIPGDAYKQYAFDPVTKTFFEAKG